MNHAPFIWGSYAVAVLAFAVLAAVSFAQHRKARRELAERGLERKR